MDPYIHATSSRGEGFRADDIGDIDHHAQQQAQVSKDLDNKSRHKKIQSCIRELVKRIFK